MASVGDGRHFWEVQIDKTVLRSHELELDYGSLLFKRNAEMIDDLVYKLNEELVRLRRLLPDAPDGYYWDFDHQKTEDLVSRKLHFRIVATLREIEPWKVID